jgi:phosphatidylglycerophosphatase A
MPGTVGSLAGAAACFPMLRLEWPLYLGVTALLAALAVWVSGRAAEELGQADPPSVIIDEFVGMWVAALVIPFQLYDLAAVFLLFRLFDVVKPSPLPRLERLPGGLGIVADDLAAGLLARATWWLLQANFDFL